jgi:hypothetical protein
VELRLTVQITEVAIQVAIPVRDADAIRPSAAQTPLGCASVVHFSAVTVGLVCCCERDGVTCRKESAKTNKISHVFYF